MNEFLFLEALLIFHFFSMLVVEVSLLFALSGYRESYCYCCLCLGLSLLYYLCDNFELSFDCGLCRGLCVAVSFFCRGLARCFFGVRFILVFVGLSGQIGI